MRCSSSLLVAVGACWEAVLIVFTAVGSAGCNKAFKTLGNAHPVLLFEGVD